MKTNAADVVIGSNFGDEGKGLVTDFLSAPYGTEALVVRHNGGAQAGHTVQTPDGVRHIFSHFGSGTLAGAATFLSRFFVANPILYLKELAKLQAVGITPKVFIDPSCLITTPYDMMINQIVEDARAGKRHGSVGVGFGETIERNLRPEFGLTFADLASNDVLAQKLRIIRAEWMPQRLYQLGVTAISDVWRERLGSDGILEHFVEDCRVFNGMVIPADTGLLRRAPYICFEGAQGLLLDQERGWFPHVTRSHTGIRNAGVLAQEAGLSKLNVYYATRSYTTRHGAGPLPYECETLPYPDITDATNVPNAWQGHLRFAWPDLDLLASTIKKDMTDRPAGLAMQHNLAITCMDQVGSTLRYVRDGKMKRATPVAYMEEASAMVGTRTCLASYGPTRNTLYSCSMPAQAARMVEASSASGEIISFSPAISSKTIVSPSIAI